jgi:uncharacterized membrane protein YphA (DoxX/SURF4 family)
MKRIILLCLRIWLGAIMIYNGRFIFTYAQDTFWHDYFKNIIHFPFPDFMFYAAKGIEFFGGLFLLFGLLTRISAAFLASTMLVATLFANIQNIYGGFGSITFSYFLILIIFILEKPGMWSIDHWLSIKKNLPRETELTIKTNADRVFILFVCLRIWFGSILIIDCCNSAIVNKQTLFFDWIFKQDNAMLDQRLYWIIFIAEMISGLLIIIGLFRKSFSKAALLIMLLMIVLSIFKSINFEGYYFLMSVILFWLACIFSVDAIYKPATQ